jgi:hypothetical protein
MRDYFVITGVLAAAVIIIVLLGYALVGMWRLRAD